MPTLLVLMIVGGIGAVWWSNARAAAEKAIVIGRDACAAAGVQLLDQTVQAERWRLRRHDSGWLGLERTFRFEYSHHGSDRHLGRLVLLGDRLIGFTGPVRETTVSSLH